MLQILPPDVKDDEKIEFLEFTVENPSSPFYADTFCNLSPDDSVSFETLSPALQEIEIPTNVGSAFPFDGFVPYHDKPVVMPRGPLFMPSKKHNASQSVIVEQSQPLLRKSTPEQKMFLSKPQAKTRKRKFVAKRTNFDKGSRSKSETGYRGVRFSTNGCRFRSTVNVNKKPFNVGTFDTAQIAAEEYDKALIRITHGRVERSRLNFPHKWNDIYAEVREVRTDLPPKRRKISHEDSWSRFAQA